MSVSATGRAIASRALVVGVPVRNEAALLPRFLAALAAQEGAPAFTLCIAFDNCDDDSAAIVAAARDTLPFDTANITLPPAPPNAGRARRGAMQLALDHAADGAMLVSTDADSLPATDWLARNVAALAGADIVAGRIVRDATFPSPVQDRVERYYDALFALRRAIDPVPWEARTTHHYTSGASLAFRTGIYRALGEFAAIPSAEDARLVDAAHRAGCRVRRDAAVRVTTSSRRHGRATDGLADHLRRLDDGDEAATMAHPADVGWRYHGHAAARAAWADIDTRVPTLAAAIGRPAAELRRLAAECVNAEAFAMRVVPDIPGGERQVTLAVAERALAALADRSAVAA